MNKRDALIRALYVAAAIIRSYLDNAEKLAPDEADADKVEAALLELADRHDRVVWSMTNTSYH